MIRLALLLTSFILVSAQAETFLGRWAIESTAPAHQVYWLEITSTSPPSGEFFGVTGGRLEKLRDATIQDNRLQFRVHRDSPVMEGTADLTLTGDTLSGTITSRGNTTAVRGRRSPQIADRDDGSWIESPRTLNLLNEWRSTDGWQITNGVISNLSAKSPLLVSKSNFWNFRLRLEYRLPKDGNAGIGLRHHYELQLADDYGQPPSVHGNASLYSQIAPAINASKPPREWQWIEVTLIGRDLTVTLNNKRVIDRQPIRGLTGLALDADESKPGPISLQGDHGPVEYRKITIAEMLRPASR